MLTLTFADVTFQNYDGHDVQLFKLLPFGKKQIHRGPSNTIYLFGKQENTYTSIADLKGKNIISTVGGSKLGTRLFLTDNGELYVSGSTLNYTKKTDKAGGPVRILDNEHVIQVACSNCAERALVLTQNKLLRIGKNWSGISKNGVLTSSHFIPRDILKIQGGVGSNDAALVLLKNGELYSMGMGCNYGELGRNEADSKQFKLVANNVDNVWTGGWHSHFTKRDGSFYAFGFNHDGRCGVQTPDVLHTPQEIIYMRNKVVMAAIGCFSTLLTKDGKVYVAGTDRNVSTYTLVRGLDHVFITRIVAGVFSMLAQSRDGKLYAYGKVDDDTSCFPEGYHEAVEIKQFADKQIVDIGAAGPYNFSVMTWE